MDEEFLVPSYYVVHKGCNDVETEFILHALRITPILAVIITDPLDAEFALKLSNEVMRTHSLPEAHELAAKLFKDTNRPVLIIGDAEFVVMYFPDGRKQNLAAHA